MPKYQFPKTDFPNLASRLPEPLQHPAGVAGGFLEQAFGLNDPGSMMGVATPLVTTVSKGQLLNNLLNLVEDLKGTPYEKAAEVAAETWPHAAGSIENITATLPVGRTVGAFIANPTARVARQPIGDIALREPPTGEILDRIRRFLSPDVPANTLGEELGHAGQALAEGPNKFLARYKEAEKALGYKLNPYETRAKKTGTLLEELADLLHGK